MQLSRPIIYLSCAPKHLHLSIAPFSVPRLTISASPNHSDLGLVSHSLLLKFHATKNESRLRVSKASILSPLGAPMPRSATSLSLMLNTKFDTASPTPTSILGQAQPLAIREFSSQLIQWLAVCFGTALMTLWHQL